MKQNIKMNITKSPTRSSCVHGIPAPNRTSFTTMGENRSGA
jgi:hypothetical protein